MNSDSKLAKFIKDNPNDPSFPESSVNYFERFEDLDVFLNKEIHPKVNLGAPAGKAIWMTDHGPDHIATVIRRASDLVFPGKPALTPYEAYILLLSIHFHDVGNLFGREEHERRCRDVIFSLDESQTGKDTAEKRMICAIATAHGGYVDLATKDKDTIGTLKYDRPRPGDNRMPRVHLLAAVLRFADELADDCTRTSRFEIEASKNFYPGSEVYHQYADRLRTVLVDSSERRVELRFELNIQSVSRKMQKDDDRKYLIEEIMERTLKMHNEHIYCTRFMLPDVLIERIVVRIGLFNDDYSQELGRISYVMAQQGYPTVPKRLAVVCPELRSLNGAGLKKRAGKIAQPVAPYMEPINLLNEIS